MSTLPPFGAVCAHKSVGWKEPRPGKTRSARQILFLRSSGGFARPRALLRAQKRRLTAKGKGVRNLFAWLQVARPHEGSPWALGAGAMHWEKVPDPFAPSGRSGACGRRWSAPAVSMRRYQPPPLRASPARRCLGRWLGKRRRLRGLGQRIWFQQRDNPDRCGCCTPCERGPLPRMAGMERRRLAARRVAALAGNAQTQKGLARVQTVFAQNLSMQNAYLW